MAFKPIPQNAIIARDGSILTPRTDSQLIKALEKLPEFETHNRGKKHPAWEAAERIKEMHLIIRELRRDVNSANREIDRAYEESIRNDLGEEW